MDNNMGLCTIHVVHVILAFIYSLCMMSNLLSLTNSCQYLLLESSSYLEDLIDMFLKDRLESLFFAFFFFHIKELLSLTLPHNRTSSRVIKKDCIYTAYARIAFFKKLVL